MKKLKISYCPFCSSTDLEIAVEWYEDGSVEFAYVLCGGCGAFGPSKDTKVDAVDSWNAAPRLLKY